MGRIRFLAVGALFLLSGVTAGHAQTFPAPGYFHELVARPAATSSLPGPTGLRAYVVNGKLRLAVADAVRLALANNTDVRLNELPVENARNDIQQAYQPFDPVTSSSFNSTRAVSPSFTQLAGASTLSSLTQQSQFNYSQMFETGTSYQIGFGASKLSTNSVFNFFNPSISSDLSLSVAQPLLRGRGLFPNRAPIVIARRNLEQSRANFIAEVNDSILQAINQYWSAVQARENLAVLRQSLDLAKASYDRDKRALELGALPPLDIYRSESQVATRRVAVIQAEYSVKQADDLLRRTLGADLDPYIRALDLDLVEKPEPAGELVTMDAKTALQKALAHRPEFDALRQLQMIDETNVRLAHNNLLPNLTLGGFYSSNGLGGNQLDVTTSPPRLVSQSGFPDALSQLFGFGFPTYGVSLTLNLPVRNRAAQATLANALVARRRALYLERQLQEAITLEVTNAVHQLEQAKLGMAAAKIALDLAQKTLEAEQRKYELGSETIFFVLDAQNALAQAEQSYLQSQIGYQLAVSELDHATGALPLRHQVEIAKTMKD